MSKESPNTLVLTKMYINEKLKLKESKSNNTHKIKKNGVYAVAVVMVAMALSQLAIPRRLNDGERCFKCLS